MGILLGIAVLLLALPALAAPTFPKLTGRVVDDANILSPATEQSLTRKLQALETSTGRQVVVATLPSLQGYEIEDYGYQLGRAWGIGSEKNDDGALLIVAPAERKVRIEVGYGLEPVLTDALSSVIIQTAILPKFRDGDMEAGIVAGTDALLAQLTLPDEEARANVAQAAEQPAKREGGASIPFIFLIIVFWVVVAALRGGRRGRRGRRGDASAAVAGAVLGSLLGSGRGGGWGGGGGGGWSGGGGFSGGGGSFGGGGSSGGW